MYTNCRQFPHLRGRTDQEIRNLVRGVLSKRPGLLRLHRIRSAMMLGAIAVVALLYSNRSQQEFGVALMVAGGVATALMLAWNVLWVNLVLFRLTKDEVGP